MLTTDRNEASRGLFATADRATCKLSVISLSGKQQRAAQRSAWVKLDPLVAAGIVHIPTLVRLVMVCCLACIMHPVSLLVANRPSLYLVECTEHYAYSTHTLVLLTIVPGKNYSSLLVPSCLSNPVGRQCVLHSVRCSYYFADYSVHTL